MSEAGAGNGEPLSGKRYCMHSILSVGIDLGTTTTQVVFSRIFMKNTAGYFTVPKISIVDREILYRSEIHPTPLVNSTLLDGEAIRKIVGGEFATAGFSPANTDTGAVIITGESAGKKNAEVITKFLSDFAGEFVVSAAGPDMESVIAGKGSGAWQYSIDNECRVANLDIGGGTTNIVWFDCGKTAAVSCLDIGGHLVLVDGQGKITSISPPAKVVARALNIELRVGMTASAAVISIITDKMAELICQALGLRPRERLLSELVTSGSSPLPQSPAADRICFSGGVADCMAGHGGGDHTGDGDRRGDVYDHSFRQYHILHGRHSAGEKYACLPAVQRGAGEVYGRRIRFSDPPHKLYHEAEQQRKCSDSGSGYGRPAVYRDQKPCRRRMPRGGRRSSRWGAAAFRR